MPVPAIRTIVPEANRNFGRFGDTVDVPPLTDIQTRSYERFLQLDIPPEKRTPTGLEGVLRDRAATVTGILNGVDYDEWSPQTDKFAASKYSLQDLVGKAKCKQDLLAAFSLKNADLKLPVIGIV